MSRVLLVEPYDSGSHAAWAAGLAGYSRHEVVTVAHPGNFWRGRMRGGAVTLADAARAAVEESGPPDVVVVSGMVDLSAWLGLTRRFLGDPPVVLYLHENQLGYPLSPNQKADDEFALANWRSLVAADAVWCNSRFQLGELTGALPALLDRAPDMPHHHLLDEVVDRCSVVPVGVELGDIDPPARRRAGPPLVLWNHRWDHDKNPAAVFSSLVRLAGEDLAFEVAVVGENLRADPREMLEARDALGTRVVCFGHLPRPEYVGMLARSDVVVSAAHHEYFGIAVVEAVVAGAIPVLPDRLSYPEVVPARWHDAALYPDGGLTERLRAVLSDPGGWRDRTTGLAGAMARFAWPQVIGAYDDGIDRLVDEYGRRP